MRTPRRREGAARDTAHRSRGRAESPARERAGSDAKRTEPRHESKGRTDRSPSNRDRSPEPTNRDHSKRGRPERSTYHERDTSKTAPRVQIAHGPLPSPGEFAWTCREGYEEDLATELRLAGRDVAPRIAGESLVVSAKPPPRREDRFDVTFARQMLPVQRVIKATSASELDARVTEALRECTGEGPWALHVWVPDSTRHNRFARNAEVLQRAIEMRAGAVDARWADRRVPNAQKARDTGGVLAQVCLVEPALALVGALPARDAISLHPGGRARMRVNEKAPSRAAMKLEEALDWLGVAPAAGETCVDLGAAPGGWTYVVMERGAKVIAIDPGAMTPELMARRGLTHIRGSAFDFEPRGPVDWLLCDMVWRPLEVASLLARWARRRWVRLLVANIKLPMRGKVDFLLRIRKILEDGGWKAVRMRQLYHDREEITLTAHT